MDNPQTHNKNGQSTDTDNKNGQSTDTDNIGHKTKNEKKQSQKYNTQN